MKKVVLIGAGKIGGQALECLGEELVEYFVDNHKAGQTYMEKSIYSMEKLMADREKYLFLLTIADMKYRDEFIDQLYRMGINDFYYFDCGIYKRNIFQKSDSQVYTRKTLYEDMVEVNPERVCVLGGERQIGRFVANLFEIENYYDETKFYLTPDLADEYDFIFVNVKNYSYKLHSQLKTTNIKIYYIAHYYNSYNFLAKRGLAEFAGKYKGEKRCFIIGNGPSLTSRDLDLLAEHNEFCIGLNMVQEIYSQTKWRPNYICISDKLVISQKLDYILENNSCPIFLSAAVQLCLSPFQYEKAILFHEANSQDRVYRVIRFGTELSNGAIPSGWPVSYTAIQLAVYMGFDKIFLLGMDNSNWTKCSSDDNSLFMNDRNEELITWVCTNAYKRAEAASIEYGFKIYNATRGGCLEEFERVNFDKLFSKLS